MNEKLISRTLAGLVAGVAALGVCVLILLAGTLKAESEQPVLANKHSVKCSEFAPSSGISSPSFNPAKDVCKQLRDIESKLRDADSRIADLEETVECFHRTSLLKMPLSQCPGP